ncbi:SRPBCC domain-containing protein [Pseudomonas sp. DNDY-54]|uniref:SRPBCC family protein n=1 Tax=Pseudomonas sp. DNDY-54 TaxID=2870860 RepID=UPI001CA38F38|nr:SRPBCC domain-containing protein [Pseudomonas sp. DNDY-54]
MPALIVRKSICISAPPSKVWNTLTSPSAIRRWMLVTPVLESDGPLQLGNRVRWNDEHGRTYLTGTVVTLDPLQKLVLALEDISWPRKARPGEVTYGLTLSESDGGSRLEFVLGDLAIDPDGQQWFEAYSASEELAIIKAMAEDRP